MACTSLTKGRGLDCNRQSGGVKFLYFSVFDQVAESNITYNAAAGVHEISAIDFGGSSIYRYRVPRGSTTVNETLTGSTENGTLFYPPTVNMVLNRLTKEDQNEIKLLGQTQVRVFAQLNAQTDNGNDVIVVLGAKNALSMNAGSSSSTADANVSVTGTAMTPSVGSLSIDLNTPVDITGIALTATAGIVNGVAWETVSTGTAQTWTAGSTGTSQTWTDVDEVEKVA